MVGSDYLHKGIYALARAHRANAMAGHLGAALVAGRFFSEEHDGIDDRVHAAVQGELDRVIAGEESWFDPEKVGITIPELFKPLPDGPSQPERVHSIADALSHNIDRLRQSGHNVIFAAMAMRAFHDYPRLATPSIVDGVCKLIEAFDGAPPGRQYYGKERGWINGDEVQLPIDDGLPPYADEQEMVDVVIDELIHTASEHRQGCGGLWHVISHAAALTELSRLGYEDLARSGLEAQGHHVRLWRVLPNLEEELGAMKRAEHDPRTPEFWATGTLKRDSARLTHRIKTLFGFSTLIRFVDDDVKRKQAEESFLYLMA